VARPREPLPEPLPPAERTVGQLVAEAIRLYGRRFWPSLALGIGPAALGVVTAALPGSARGAVAIAAGPLLLSASYVGGAVLALDTERTLRRLGLAFLVGIPAFVPLMVSRVVIFPGIYLLAIGCFAAVGLAVPVTLVERRGALAAYRRALALARADVVHALGAVATLVIGIVVASLGLFVLLAAFGDAGGPAAAFVSLLVLSPLFFLGAALLYVDQQARVRLDRDIKAISTS
jgi:hypothetical protein